MKRQHNDDLALYLVMPSSAGIHPQLLTTWQPHGKSTDLSADCGDTELRGGEEGQVAICREDDCDDQIKYKLSYTYRPLC